MTLERRTKFDCFVCHSAAGNTFADVVRHIGYVHAHDPNFHVVCGIEGCTRTYRNFLSYKRHLYREHKHFVGKENGEGASDESSDHEDTSEPMSVTAAADGSFFPVISAQESARKLKQNRAALFILKTSEIRRLPLSTMESLLPDIATLVEHAIFHVQDRLLEALAKEPITDDTIRSICQDDDISSPFSGMETTYQHTQYFKAHLHMIVRHACCCKSIL